ncbi:MAG: IS5 family transposase [Opitutaceae bacterium]|nr:IS5 family transposase [Opitutaceae bacterium]
MRGQLPSQPSFASLISVETLIAADHPIRPIKRLCDEALRAMSGHFDEIYAAAGAPSIPPETLLKGKVLQAPYTVRRVRQLCARLQTDLLFRWFVDLPLDAAEFDASTFSKNQTRLLAHEVADLFFYEVVEVARRNGWVSEDHFSVDATLIEAWASLKSFKPKGAGHGPGSGNSWTDFKGEQRGNATHESNTDAEAKLVRKGPGKEARMCFAGHATMENRHGLCVLFEVQPAVGAPESAVAVDQAIELRNRGFKPKTNGGDKAYHTAEFVTGLRELGIVPHPALKAGRKTLRVVCTVAHAASQKVRKRIEDIFGWSKATGGVRQSRYRGVARTHAHGQYVVATWNLVRMAKLLLSGPPKGARA